MEFAEIVPLIRLFQLDIDNFPEMEHHQVKYVSDFSKAHDIESHSSRYHNIPMGHVRDLSTAFSVNLSHGAHHQHFIASAALPGGIVSFGDNQHDTEGFEFGIGEVVAQPTDSLSSVPTIEDLPLRLPLWALVILVIGYALVFVCGVVGNCSVLFVVIRLRRMKTLVNLFIINLAVADLLVLFVCLLPNLVSNIFVPWVLGWYLCKTVPYIQGVSVCASIYSLLAISVERCISIQWPFKHLVTKERAKLIILGIWIWSGLVALPWALFFESGNFDEENPQHEFCIEVWPKDFANWDKYYFLVGNLLICYLFPLVVILICYLTIWFRVYRRQIPSDSYHKAMELIHQKSKTAVLKMITVVVLIFAFSWLPLYVIITRLKFGPQEVSELETTIISFVYPIAQWLISFNSCMNAIIYSFLNHKFRKAFEKILNQGCWGNWRKKKSLVKHKSPTVNILLKRFSTYRVETTMSNNNNEVDSSETI